jgi:hypothetical protein
VLKTNSLQQSIAWASLTGYNIKCVGGVVFNATFNNISAISCSQFYYWRKPEYSEKTTDLSSWSWSYGRWICNFLYNKCLSPLMLWFRIQLRQGVLDTILCDKVCQWLATGQWFSPSTLVSSNNKTDCTI